jgi:glycosyltransferase involved in cell wall biosynthesis
LDNKRIEADGGKRAVALRGKVFGRRRSCARYTYLGYPVLKAVVSTRAGCEGIATSSNGEIVRADTPEAFASSVIELLLSEERRRALGERARQVVIREYKWSVIHARLRRVYQSLKLSSEQFVGIEG